MLRRSYWLLLWVLLSPVTMANDMMAMIDLVREAKTFAIEQGKSKALKEFSEGAQFKDGSLYIFAYDFKGNVLAHGANPALVGRNLLDLKDAKGLQVIKALLVEAKAGSGVVEYHWLHPKYDKVMLKLGYVEKVDDTYWIGSGIYIDK